jgi:16S rRNA (guanine966-N2)-methyltransferase
VTRLIAGSAGGRPLRVPERGTRPTSDRAREALFSALLARLGSLTGRRVLDLYAGSGAVGLEALSRGAALVVLVESDPRAVRVIRENVRRIGLPGARVLAERVERFAAGASGVPAAGAAAGSVPAASAASAAEPPFDVVFLDPPYAVSDQAVRGVLADLAERGVLADGALVVVERESRAGAFAWPVQVVADTSKRYGEATLWYGRAALRDTSAARGTRRSDLDGER